MTPLPTVRVGLPYLPSEEGYEQGHPFLVAVRELKAPVLISVGSLYRPDEGFRRLQLPAWGMDVSIDSAGFVAMAKFGRYRWSVQDYVDQIIGNFGGDDIDDDEPPRWSLPHPWSWWSPPDYCCEPKVAKDRAEVERRMELTAESLSETLAHLEDWRQAGENTTPDPMPILQGWKPADYQRSVELIRRVVVESARCSCSVDPEACDATWHSTDAPDLPALVGVGSVCTRAVGGPDGLLNVLRALDEALPPHVRLHLFGVKGEALWKMGELRHRVASVDSMAWDKAASWEADKRSKAAGYRISCDLDMRVRHLRHWHAAQLSPRQTRLC